MPQNTMLSSTLKCLKTFAVALAHKEPQSMDSEKTAFQLTQSFTLFGIRFAPLMVPLERRVQTLCLSLLLYISMLGGVTTMAFLFYLYSYTSLQWITLAYLAWCVYDRSARLSSWDRPTFQWLRSLRIYGYAARYFPIKLVKTTELPADQSYLLCYHPHGITSFGAFFAFATNVLGFRELFPGLEPYLLTLKQQFWSFGNREYLHGLGMRAATKESMESLLAQPEGVASTLVVGGAIEALNYGQDQIELVLNKRRGFIKLALRFGRDLVPVFGFGENFAYKVVPYPEGSRVRRFQDWLERHIAFTMPVFHGRGFFNYTFGFLPFRQPINVVVGEPMKVNRIENPSSDDIEQTHKRYVEALQALYDKFNPLYGDPNIRLAVS